MLTEEASNQLLDKLKQRFENNVYRHVDLTWEDVLQELINNSLILNSLDQMECSGGEPDIVLLNGNVDDIIFYDCCIETPKLRRGFCYDRAALESRKDYPPRNNVVDVVHEMGVELLTESEYRALQNIFNFDLKTSSWVLTPSDIRKRGGAIFCDNRYGHVFTYHNSAQSYYTSRGFRCKLIL